MKDDPVVLEHLGDIYLKLDQKEEAVDAWKKSLEFHEQEEGLKRYLFVTAAVDESKFPVPTKETIPEDAKLQGPALPPGAGEPKADADPKAEPAEP